LKIIISSVAKKPIYEQIKDQIREYILSGELAKESQLPSIRLLARELKVGIITIKRVYDDLCKEEILVSRPGKGVFVGSLDFVQIKKINIELVKEQLRDIKEYADSVGINKDDIDEILNSLYKGE
jgi:GntR family transcriptional regulator